MTATFDVVTWPVLSVLLAVSRYSPAGTFVHTTEYGAVAADPISVSPL